MGEQPDWQPISRLPLIGSMIDGMLQDAEEHYQTLLQASPKPHVLDDYTVGRVFEGRSVAVRGAVRALEDGQTQRRSAP